MYYFHPLRDSVFLSILNLTNRYYSNLNNPYLSPPKVTARILLPDDNHVDIKCTAIDTPASLKSRAWARVARSCAWMHSPCWHGDVTLSEATARLRTAIVLPANFGYSVFIPLN